MMSKYNTDWRDTSSPFSPLKMLWSKCVATSLFASEMTVPLKEDSSSGSAVSDVPIPLRAEIFRCLPGTDFQCD